MAVFVSSKRLGTSRCNDVTTLVPLQLLILPDVKLFNIKTFVCSETTLRISSFSSYNYYIVFRSIGGEWSFKISKKRLVNSGRRGDFSRRRKSEEDLKSEDTARESFKSKFPTISQRKVFARISIFFFRTRHSCATWLWNLMSILE